MGALAAGLTLGLGVLAGASFETQFVRAAVAGAGFAALGWLAAAALGFVDGARTAGPAGAAPQGAAGGAHAPGAAAPGVPAAGRSGGHPGRGRLMDVLVDDDPARRN